MLWPFSIIGRLKRTKHPPPGIFIGDEFLSWLECCMGIFVTGQPGSGKSFFLLSLIEQLAGRAMIVATTTKPTDYGDILRIYERAGLGHLVIRLGMGSDRKINVGRFLTETLPGGSPRVLTRGITMTGEVLAQSGAGGGERFWDQLIADVAYYSALLSILATGSAELTTILDVITSLPCSPGESDSDSFYSNTTCGRLLRLATDRRTPQTLDKLERVIAFVDRMASIGDKARTAGVQGASSAIASLVIEFGDQVSAETNVDLFECDRDKCCLVIDGNPLVHHAAGKAFNFINAACVQFWATSRDPSGLVTPCFLIRDEIGWCLNSNLDASIQAIGRSQFLASVSAGQNLPIIASGLGGDEKARIQSQAFASLHAHKLFFANACTDTNEWASKVIGDHKEIHISTSPGAPATPNLWDDLLGANVSVSTHEQFTPKIRPADYAALPTGSCYLHRQGMHRKIDLWQGARR